ncbi:MAG: DUF308 domain-containing protein [Burkholderiales bacterium]
MAEATAPEMRKAGLWVIVWGVLLMIAGVLAILEPPIAALAAELLLAWLFVFGGIVQIVYALQNRAAPGFRLHILSAILTFLLGVFMLMRPTLGITSVALLLGAFLMANGVSEVLHGFRLKPTKGWGWVVFDGVLSVVIALMIANHWPEGSIQFIGVLVGVLMIYGGVWRIMLGSALRNAGSTTAPSAPGVAAR